MPIFIILIIALTPLLLEVDENTFISSRAESAESYTLNLPFDPTTLEVDENAEEEILGLVNQERVKAGLKPLVIDSVIREVARKHSLDMWQREFFAHKNPDRETPFDRMEEGEAKFSKAGENLAFARTVKRAHEGLMKSEGHRKNILDPEFGRIGIGVVDGGIFGKMFTQNFAD